MFYSILYLSLPHFACCSNVNSDRLESVHRRRNVDHVRSGRHIIYCETSIKSSGTKQWLAKKNSAWHCCVLVLFLFRSCFRNARMKPDEADVLLSIQQHVRERCPLLGSRAVHERAALDAEFLFALRCRVKARAEPKQQHRQYETLTMSEEHLNKNIHVNVHKLSIAH